MTESHLLSCNMSFNSRLKQTAGPLVINLDRWHYQLVTRQETHQYSIPYEKTVKYIRYGHDDLETANMYCQIVSLILHLTSGLHGSCTERIGSFNSDVQRHRLALSYAGRQIAMHFINCIYPVHYQYVKASLQQESHQQVVHVCAARLQTMLRCYPFWVNSWWRRLLSGLLKEKTFLSIWKHMCDGNSDPVRQGMRTRACVNQCDVVTGHCSDQFQARSTRNQPSKTFSRQARAHRPFRHESCAH